MIEVGKTYTGKNGIEWLCIAVDGEYAYMRLPDNPAGSAYCFKTDGTNISQGGGDWDVQFEPVIKTVTRHLDAIETSSYAGHSRFEFEYGSMQLTFETIDGVIDWSTARITDYN